MTPVDARGSNRPRLRVAAVDEHPVVLTGLVSALAAAASDLEVVATAGTTQALLDAGPIDVDVVLLDLGLLGRGDRHPDREVRALLARGMQVVVFASEEDQWSLSSARAAGAWGIASKVETIETIASRVRDCGRGARR